MKYQLELRGQPARTFDSWPELSGHIKTLQPGYRDKKRARIHLGDWFTNQGQRSRLLFQRSYVFGRIDRL